MERRHSGVVGYLLVPLSRRLEQPAGKGNMQTCLILAQHAWFSSKPVWCPSQTSRPRPPSTTFTPEACPLGLAVPSCSPSDTACSARRPRGDGAAPLTRLLRSRLRWRVPTPPTLPVIMLALMAVLAVETGVAVTMVMVRVMRVAEAKESGIGMLMTIVAAVGIAVPSVVDVAEEAATTSAA